MTIDLEDEEGEEPEPGREVPGHPEGGEGGAEVKAGLPDGALQEAQPPVRRSSD